MKYIYITILVLFIKISSFAQTEDDIIETEPVNVEGEYFSIADSQLNKFKGTWIFTNNNLEIFKIKIDVQKRVYIDDLKCYTDNLIAYFCFNEDSSCNLNSRENVSFIEYDDNLQLLDDMIYLSIKDPITGKYGKGAFKIISSERVSWKLYNTSPPFNDPGKSFELPTDVILNRIRN